MTFLSSVQFPTGNKAARPASGTAAKGPSQGNKCNSCGKTVYPMEKLEADGRMFHKFCFKCTECKNTLRYIVYLFYIYYLCYSYFNSKSSEIKLQF